MVSKELTLALLANLNRFSKDDVISSNENSSFSCRLMLKSRTWVPAQAFGFRIPGSKVNTFRLGLLADDDGFPLKHSSSLMGLYSSFLLKPVHENLKNEWPLPEVAFLFRELFN